MTDAPLVAAQRRLAFNGAVMMFVGMLYGLYVALVMTGDAPGQAHIALGAHINALLGSLWLLGMGWSLKLAVLSHRLLQIAVWSTLVGAWSNWIVSALKAVTGDVAISFIGAGTNDALFAARIVLVVIPCLVGPGVWAWGLRRSPG